MRSTRRPSRRPGRLLDRAQPALLPRAARRRSATTGSPRSRASAARRSGTSRARRRDRPARGADATAAHDRYRVGLHHVAFEAWSRGAVDERARVARRARAPRSRAAPRSTATSRATTRCSSTTRTGSSSRSSTCRRPGRRPPRPEGSASAAISAASPRFRTTSSPPAADDVLDLGSLVARHDDELRLVASHRLVLARVSRDRRVQSSSPHSQTSSSTPSPRPQVSLPSRSRSFRARKRTSFSAIRRSRACTRPTLRRYRIGRGGMARECPPGSIEEGWSSICRRPRRRSARPGRRRPARGARRASGGPLRRPAARQRAVHERGQVRPPA